MQERERELRGIFTRIAVVLIFLILFFNLYSLACEGHDWLVSRFPRAIWLDCVADIFCSLLYFLSFLLPVLIFYGLSSKRTAKPIDFSVPSYTPHTGIQSIAILFVSVGAVVSFSYFNSWLVPSFTSTGSGVMRETQPYQLVLSVFSTAMIPAAAEELLFRGMIISNLKPYGKGMAVLVSALLFGLMHTNLSQLLYATAAGVVLGAVYVMTNSLWLCMLIHFFNNLFSILESYLYDIFAPRTAGLVCLLADLLLFALGSFFALIYLNLKKREAADSKEKGIFGETVVIEEKRFVAGNVATRAFFCPAMVVYLAAVGVNMLYALFVPLL